MIHSAYRYKIVVVVVVPFRISNFEYFTSESLKDKHVSEISGLGSKLTSNLEESGIAKHTIKSVILVTLHAIKETQQILLT
ncbi:unnamed protein product [Rotaria socialis]